jgi:predicted transcriptional regulator/thymidine kinase
VYKYIFYLIKPDRLFSPPPFLLDPPYKQHNKDLSKMSQLGTPDYALPYELTSSYVMTKKVLATELNNALQDPVGYIKIKNMLSAPVVSGSLDNDNLNGTVANKDDAARLLQHMNKAPRDINQPVSMPVMTAVLSTIDPAATDVTIAGLLESVRTMCQAFFDAELQSGLNMQGAMANSLISTVKKTFNDAFHIMDNMMPFSQISGVPAAPVSEAKTVQTSAYKSQALGVYASGVTLKDHLGNIESILAEYRATKINPNLQDWLFTESLMTTYYACHLPYFRLKFIASYVRGDWNKAGNISDVSFYDARYAELVMYKLGMAVYGVLEATVRTGDERMDAALVAAAASSKYKKQPVTEVNLRASLRTITSSYTSTMNIKIQQLEKTLMTAHGKIAALSVQTKTQAASLYRSDADFKFRRQTLQSLTATVTIDEARFERQRRAFRAWVVAYMVITVIAIALLATNRNNAFMLMSAVIIGFVIIYTMVTVIAKAVRRIV